MFNTSLTSAKVPGIWKKSNVSPVYKKMIKLMLKITGLFHFKISSIGKTFEKSVHKHRGFLAKLYHYGITGYLHKWFKSYLSHRFQRVTIPGSSSDWVEIKADVQQGSIL